MRSARDTRRWDLRFQEGIFDSNSGFEPADEAFGWYDMNFSEVRRKSWNSLGLSWCTVGGFALFRGFRNDKCLNLGNAGWVVALYSFVVTQTTLKTWIEMICSAASGHFFDKELQLCGDICLPPPARHQNNNPYRTVRRSALFFICINDGVTFFHNSEKDSFWIHVCHTCDHNTFLSMGGAAGAVKPFANNP